MVRFPLRTLLPFLIAGFLPATLAAEDWPHWRGPTHDGVSGETGLPVEWDTENGIVWKAPMPAWSGATPIISGDTIFLNVSIPADAAGVPANPSEGYRRRRGAVSAAAATSPIRATSNSGRSIETTERCAGRAISATATPAAGSRTCPHRLPSPTGITCSC